MEERFTVIGIALALTCLMGEPEVDWYIPSEWMDAEWWELIMWVKRN